MPRRRPTGRSTSAGPLACLFALAAACGPPNAADDDGAGSGTGTSRAAGRGPSGDGGSLYHLTNPWAPISVGATEGSFTEAFDVAISGQGSDGGVGTVAISGNVGTLELAGVTYPVVAYAQDHFAAANNDTLYELLGATPDELIVAWAYCNSGALDFIYYETTAGVAVTGEAATGSCAATASSQTASARFPAFNLGSLDLVQGFSLDGSQLAYDGSDAGIMQLGGAQFWIYPFNLVDCRGCGDGSAGWYELHSLLWNPTDAEACFGIYYLFVESPPKADVPLDYVLCLPGLDDPTHGRADFPATYGYPPDAG